MGYWVDRLKRSAVRWEATTSRFDVEVLTLDDPDGLKLELGSNLKLPSWLENRRVELEQVLPRLTIPRLEEEIKPTGRISSPAR